jgi:hypothetical protein
MQPPKPTLKIPKMTTGMERIFRRVSPPGVNPTVYQEFMLHFIHYMDTDGSKLRTKLDKTIPGMYYREAGPNEHSLYGEYTYTFPEDGVSRRIIAIPRDKF